MIDGKPKTIEPVRSLVESAGDGDDSVVLPSDLLEQVMEPDPDSKADTIHDEDDDEDPFEALDRLAELEVPDSDGKTG